MSADMTPQVVEDGLKISATGNPLKPGRHESWLTVTGADETNGNDIDGSPEVHVMIEGCCGDFAQGWFRIADLEAAITAAREATS